MIIKSCPVRAYPNHKNHIAAEKPQIMGWFRSTIGQLYAENIVKTSSILIRLQCAKMGQVALDSRQGWGLLNQFPPFRYFLIFVASPKHMLSVMQKFWKVLSGIENFAYGKMIWIKWNIEIRLNHYYLFIVIKIKSRQGHSQIIQAI